MANLNVIVGNDGSNTLQGTAGADLIYGYDPDGAQSQASSILATRVATDLTEPLFAGAPPGDSSRLFIVEKTGAIKIFDLASGQVLPTPFLNLSGQIASDGERGLLGLAFDPDFANNGFFYINVSNPNGNTDVRRYHVDPATPNVPTRPAPHRSSRSTNQRSAITRAVGSASVPTEICTSRLATAGAVVIRCTAGRTSTACSVRSCVSTCTGTTSQAIPRTTITCLEIIPY